MSKISNLNEIDSIKVHWSESEYINNVLCCDENSDIEKEVDVFAFDSIISQASKEISSGYDKTSLSIKLKSGLQWCFESKFHITSRTSNLLELLNVGQ
ncbi:MAG: hypothetical protein GW763_11305 [Paraglaciecola sp.]|nr:hypothetical protein [Paraglaciecola sp.]NCT48555.1 hypothetical protein [Paraglaciecola sp.]